MGADLTFPDAVGMGGTELLEQLLAAGRDINEFNSQDDTALVKACEHYVETDADEGLRYIIWLLEHGADINRCHPMSLTPLVQAIWTKKPGLVSLLLHMGADPEVVTFRDEPTAVNAYDAALDEHSQSARWEEKYTGEVLGILESHARKHLKWPSDVVDEAEQ